MRRRGRPPTGTPHGGSDRRSITRGLRLSVSDPGDGPPSRAAHASARSMPCDAAGALAIRSGEQHGLNVIVVIDQQRLDRSGRPMQAGSEIFRQRLPMWEDLPLKGDGPAPGDGGDGALDVAVIAGEQRCQRAAPSAWPALRGSGTAGPDTRSAYPNGSASDDAVVLQAPPSMLEPRRHHAAERRSSSPSTQALPPTCSRRRAGVRCCPRSRCGACLCHLREGHNPAPLTGQRRRASSSGPPSRRSHHGCGLCATSPRSRFDRCRSWNNGTAGGSAARRRERRRELLEVSLTLTVAPAPDQQGDVSALAAWSVIGGLAVPLRSASAKRREWLR